MFREFTTFYPPTRAGRFNNGYGDTTPTTSLAFSRSEYDSEAVDGSTVWNQRPIASYLNSSSPEPSTASYTRTHDTVSLTGRYTLDTTSRYSDGEGSEDEGDESYLDDAVDNRHYDDGLLNDEDQPSLGFAGALDFLAAERARFVAQRDALGQRGNGSTTSDGTWRHPLANRRKRRRNRNKSARRPAPAASTEDLRIGTTASQDDTDDSSSSSLDRPSSPHYYKSTPPTPPPDNDRQRQRSAAPANAQRFTMHHSKSTPSLRLPKSLPIDPRVLQLRNLAHKLRMFYPREAETLEETLSDDHPSPSEIVDPRGPIPRSQDTLIHVFIDQYVTNCFSRMSDLTLTTH